MATRHTIRYFLKFICLLHYLCLIFLIKAVAHVATEDDVYRGYRIPEGTTILPNAWYSTTETLTFIPILTCIFDLRAMFRNPKEYPEPDKFIPERWLVDKPPTEANKAAFGFGRR